MDAARLTRADNRRHGHRRTAQGSSSHARPFDRTAIRPLQRELTMERRREPYTTFGLGRLVSTISMIL